MDLRRVIARIMPSGHLFRQGFFFEARSFVLRKVGLNRRLSCRLSNVSSTASALRRVQGRKDVEKDRVYRVLIWVLLYTTY